ncbi:MAG: hypothetical protein JWN27_536, partial [Candidatus Eremiobacteraeota bacterium]|nr:hypothetical protein [Candidatus Eremiobacteraeota bacterium]
GDARDAAARARLREKTIVLGRVDLQRIAGDRRKREAILRFEI